MTAAQLAPQSRERDGQLGRRLDRIRGAMRHGGMAAPAGENKPARELALVRAGDPQAGGLANDAQRRRCRQRRRRGDKVRRPGAADLFVIGEAEVHRRRGRRLPEGRDVREHDRDEAFHVGRTAPIDAAVANVGLERIARPVLSFGGNDVGMGGERDARPVRWAYGGENGSLVAGGIRDEARLDALGPQQRDNVLDDGEIGSDAHRRKGDEVGEDAQAAIERGLVVCRCAVHIGCRPRTLRDIDRPHATQATCGRRRGAVRIDRAHELFPVTLSERPAALRTKSSGPEKSNEL